MGLNEKLNKYFQKIETSLFNSGNKKFKRLKKMSDDELILRYSNLKAKNYLHEKLSFLIIPALILATLTGIAKITIDFIQKLSATGVDDSNVIMAGGISFLLVVTILVILILVIYWKNIKSSKEEYFLIEFILKKRKIGANEKDD